MSGPEVSRSEHYRVGDTGRWIQREAEKERLILLASHHLFLRFVRRLSKEGAAVTKADSEKLVTAAYRLIYIS